MLDLEWGSWLGVGRLTVAGRAYWACGGEGFTV